MRKATLIITLLIFAFSTVCAYAGTTKTYKSGANSNSEKITYKLEVTPIRTGEKTANVKWKLTPTWTKNKEDHGSPSKVTCTLASGGKKKSVVIKKSGDNTLYTKSGTFKIKVKPKQVSINISLQASSSGSYKTKHTRNTTYYETSTEHRIGYAQPDYTYKYEHCCWSSSHKVYVAGYKINDWQTISTKKTKKETYYKTHYTDSGVLKTHKLKVKGMEKYYYISYNSVGGTKAPAKHGFIGGKSATISKKYPSFKYKDAGISATAKGWSKTKYTPGAGSPDAALKGGAKYSTRADLTLYAVYPQRYYVKYDALGGDPAPKTQWHLEDKTIKITATIPKYYRDDIAKDGYTLAGWTETAKKDITAGTVQYVKNNLFKKNANVTLYAIATPNKVARIIYNKNCEGEAYDIPEAQDKYYNIPVSLSSNVPTRPDVVNKGQRRVFLAWNTKADGTGYSYNAGANFTLNANPHEPIPQSVINLYAIWYDGNALATEEEVDGGTVPGIRYIEKDAINSLGEDSKWRSGVRQQQLEDSLNSDEAKSTYDSSGNKVK